MKTLAILLAVITWGRFNPATQDVDYYMDEPKSEAEMRADGWKEVVETREPRPIGSMADYKYIWQATAWEETEKMLSRHWKVKFCKDITQVTAEDITNIVVEVTKEVEK